jgi:hypothetical protein
LISIDKPQATVGSHRDPIKEILFRDLQHALNNAELKPIFVEDGCPDFKSQV